MTKPRGQSIFLLGCVLAPLSACAGMLGGGKPDSLYRFAIPGRPAPEATSTAGPRRTVRLARFRFAPEIAGDGILTSSGDGIMYLKDARWVAPVPDQMLAAVVRQFDQRAAAVNLVASSSRRPADETDGRDLHLAFDRFEAHYSQGYHAPPDIIVSVRAVISDSGNQRTIAQERFDIRESASANNRKAILSAFNTAVDRMTASVADWTNSAAFYNSEL